MKEGKKAFWITSGITHGILLTLVSYALLFAVIFTIFTIVTTKPSTSKFPASKLNFLPEESKEEKAILIAQENNPSVTVKALAKDLKGDIQINSWVAKKAEDQGLEFDWFAINNAQPKESKELIDEIMESITTIQNQETKVSLLKDFYLPLIEDSTSDIDKNRAIFHYARGILVQKDELLKQENGNEVKLALDKLAESFNKLNQITDKYKFYYDNDLYYVSFSWAGMEDRASGSFAGYFYEVNVKEEICRPIAGDEVLSRKYALRKNIIQKDRFKDVDIFGRMRANLSFEEVREILGKPDSITAINERHIKWVYEGHGFLLFYRDTKKLAFWQIERVTGGDMN